MIDLLPQDTVSIPFVLQKQIVASVDTIPGYDFSSYQYLPLDSAKLFYDADAISQHVVYSGLEGLVRPFMQQFGSVLFLVFTLLFVVSSIVFKRSGRSLFSDFGEVFTLSSSKKSSYRKQATTTDLWSALFYILQALIIYSLLFSDFVLQYSSLYYNGYDYLVLVSQIFGVAFLFFLCKYLFYKFMGAVFSNSKTNSLINVYLWVVNLTGIISFIPIVAYFYIPEVRMYVLIFLLALFIVGRIAVFAKSHTFFVQSHIGSLYFFVYLCAVEIMPYVLLYKAAVLIN